MPLRDPPDIMESMRNLLTTTAKFGLALVIVMMTFGYLLAGLSSSPMPLDGPEATPMASAAGSPDSVEPEDPVPPMVSKSKPDGPAKRWSAKRESFEKTVALAAERQSEYLDDRGLSSADPASWMTVCRRLSLALVGSGVSVKEIRFLESIPESKRVQKHLERLLDDPRHHAYWSERWTRLLVGNDEGEFLTFRRRRFRSWVAQCLADNVRYDDWVRQMITAEGIWTDRPEVNFLTATFDSNGSQPDPIRLAARTSRVFLGLRIDCLQCHDDFLGNVSLGEPGQRRGGMQTDFHSLAAFFTAAENNGLQGVRTRDADYQYQYLDADEEVDVTPTVPYGQSWLPEEGDDRTRLATWITDPRNRQFARSAVSHVWTLMFGRCDGEAMDNLPLDEQSHPVLETYVDDFIEHDFNLRRLIHLIARSGPFTVDSRADFEITPAHEDAGAVFPLVRLRAEQVAGAISQAARIKTIDRESSVFLQFMKYTTGNEFVNRYGDRGEDELADDAGTIAQRLIMMNGKLPRESVSPNPFLNTTSHIDMFSRDDRATVETAYLAVLNRLPTDGESEHFTTKLASAPRRQACLEDLMWVLVNSSEFAWNH